MRASQFEHGPSQRPLETGAVGGYLHDIRRFAMLEKDQEYASPTRWRHHGDRDAADQLVSSHLRLAVKVAMGYRGYGLPVSEDHLRRQRWPDAGTESL